MYSTNGHQLVVNDYYAACLRKARETEARRDAERARGGGGSADAVSPPDEPRPPVPDPT